MSGAGPASANFAAGQSCEPGSGRPPARPGSRHWRPRDRPGAGFAALVGARQARPLTLGQVAPLAAGAGQEEYGLDIWRRGMTAGARRRPGELNRSAASSHCSSVKAIAKLMPAPCPSNASAQVTQNPRSGHELSATGHNLPTAGGEHQTLCQNKRVHLILGVPRVGTRPYREASTILTRISTQTEPFGRPG
jgi:hypothetical protein